MERPNNYLTIERALELIESGEEKPLKGLPMAQIIDIATDYREIIRKKDKEVTAMKSKFAVMEQAILHAMQAAGTEDSPLIKAGGLQSTATITESDVPSVEDWDKVYEWIVNNEAFHLIQKRIAAKAWNEERALGEEIPGISCYKQLKISLRKT